jgi:hypothetical protein
MSAPPWDLRAALRAWAAGWQAFFHQPCDGRLCAALRIGLATLTLIHFAVLYPDLTTFFTDEGVLPLAAAREVVSPYSWSLLFHLPQTRLAVEACFWAAVVGGAALLLGIVPRVAAVWTFVWLVSFQNRNWLINDGEDGILRMLIFLLIFVPTGRCWALQHPLRHLLFRHLWPRTVRPGPPQAAAVAGPVGWLPSDVSQTYFVPGWGRRLIQLEMAGMFFSAGLCKLGGHSWLDGTALYYVARLDDFFGKLPVPDFTVDHPLAVACLTWGVLIIELAVPVLIWFRQTRRGCLLALLLFHLANEWTMHLFLFHWIMLCGWMSFLEEEDYAWLARCGPAVGRRLRGVAASRGTASGTGPRESL